MCKTEADISHNRRTKDGRTDTAMGNALSLNTSQYSEPTSQSSPHKERTAIPLDSKKLIIKSERHSQHVARINSGQSNTNSPPKQQKLTRRALLKTVTENMVHSQIRRLSKNIRYRHRRHLLKNNTSTTTQVSRSSCLILYSCIYHL